MSELRTEAGLLIETLQARLQELRSAIPTTPVEPTDLHTAAAGGPSCAQCGAAAPTSAEPASAGSSCTGCPLCTLLAVLRGERPELAGALLDGAVSALQLVRSLVAEQPAAGTAPTPADADADADADAGGGRTVAGQDSPPISEPASPAAAQRRPPERIRIS